MEIFKDDFLEKLHAKRLAQEQAAQQAMATMNAADPMKRDGVICFGDASMSVWEEGIKQARDAGGYKAATRWEQLFKRAVFARIIQQLRRLGWTVQPQHYIHTSNNARFCFKGDLKADLRISGRHIELDMFQSVNCPTRPDNEGRYEWNKEALMPYLVRLEMERTRRRIRDYLCNVFSGYTFGEKSQSIHRKPLQHTAMERIAEHYAQSWHFKGDMPSYLLRSSHTELPLYNSKSADGQRLVHGQKVFATDCKGRWVCGTAMYNINNMWWLVLGKYDYTNKACFDLYASAPQCPRTKSNERLQRKRLQQELASARAAGNMQRVQLLCKLLWPNDEPRYLVAKKGAFFCPDYNGYTKDKNAAGRYTKAELAHYMNQIQRGELSLMPEEFLESA